MAPSVSRWQDIVLNPCNRSAERRNTAAIREALQALAEAQPETVVTPEGGGSDLIFFQVQADAVLSATVAAKEMLYNTVSGDWEPTGADYTVYEWSGRNQFSVNFRNGALGVGRINTTVSATALEPIVIEGLARVIQVSLTEDMGATTTKQASADVDFYWGDMLNGMNPGASVTIYDDTNMAPNHKDGNTALAIFDEKRQRYVMIAPWNGNQAPGQAAVVKIGGGDATRACDDSVEEDDYCLYTGSLQSLSTGGDLCAEKFTDGASIWIVDGRSCHANSRLNHLERYVAVSTGLTFDPDPMGPGTDERAVYAVVDYSPSLRWFRVMTDTETLALASAEVNDMKCRSHDCGGDQPDDAPSVWGVWEDIDPCTRALQVLDNNPVLIYFPRYRSRCTPEEEQTEENQCLSKDVDPDCRKNAHVLAWWNPIAERWDSLNDAERCTEGQDVAFVVICCGTVSGEGLCEADLTCCVFDGLKVTIWPRNESYCDPVREMQQIWIRCTNGQLSITDGWCGLAKRICDSFVCNGEERPVYLVQCGQCDPCACPSYLENVIRWQIKVANPAGPCGYIHEKSGTMHCMDYNPFVASPGPATGWYSDFSVAGLTPRLIYFTEPKDTVTYPNGAWLEVACGGEASAPGTILSAWDDNGSGGWASIPIPTPLDYDAGLSTCAHLTIGDGFGNEIPQYRARNYNYGIWAQCSGGSLSNVTLYLLEHDEWLNRFSYNPTCSNGSPLDGAKSVVVYSSNFSDGEGLATGSRCCHNWQRICMTDKNFGCTQTADVPVPDLVGAVGQIHCTPCNHPGSGHLFAGCPCNWIVTSVGNCVFGPNACIVGPFPSATEHLCCDHPDNEICFEFQWPYVVSLP